MKGNDLMTVNEIYKMYKDYNLGLLQKEFDAVIYYIETYRKLGFDLEVKRLTVKYEILKSLIAEKSV
jgi:hypothetical protein